jgi:predicted PurR-regulated permease PerM
MTNKFSSIIAVFWLVVTLIGIVVGAYLLRSILLLLFMAIIFASALHPMVELGRKWKIPAPITIFTLYALIFAVVSFLLSLIVPPLAQQTVQLISSATTTLGLSEIDLNGFGHLDMSFWANSFDQYGSIFNQFTGSISTALGILFSTFSAVFVFFTLLVMTFHTLMSMDHVAFSYAWMLPGSKSEKLDLAKKIMSAVRLQLGSWVRGQLTLMFLIGAVTYIGLLMLGIPYALPLALLAGFLEFVPNLGPIIASIPAIAVASLVVSPWMGVFTMLFYLLVQQLENNLIVPMIMRNAVDIHPLTTILLMLVGYELMGVIGAVAVVPLYLCIRTIWKIIWPDRGPFMQFRA